MQLHFLLRSAMITVLSGSIPGEKGSSCMLKRLIALLLAACLCISILPMAVFAEDTSESPSETTQVTEAPQEEPPTEPPASAPAETTAPAATEPAETTLPTVPAETTAPTDPSETTEPSDPTIVTTPPEQVSIPVSFSAEPEPVAVTGVRLPYTSDTIFISEVSNQLNVTIRPDNATNKNVTWNSSNPAVASVDSNGLVTPLQNGVTTITVTTEDGGFTATCKITVMGGQSEVPVTGVELSEHQLNMTVGGKMVQLSDTVKPEDASVNSFKYYSSNRAVADVTPTGWVRVKAPGTAIITVETIEGAFTDTCTVTVTAPVTGVSLDQTSVTLDKDTTCQLTPVFVPENASNKNVTWSSSDETVATVSDTGLVTALKFGGEATITVTTEDGGYTATCAVKVNGISIADAAVQLDEASFTYDGTAHSPAVTVKLGDDTLTQGEDYTVTYTNNTGAGTATVTVTGCGEYSGTASTTFTIDKAAAPTIEFPTLGSIVYGQKLSEVTLTGGSTNLGTFAWMNPDYLPPVNAQVDTETVQMTFVPSEDTKNNYEIDFESKTETLCPTVTPRPITVTANSFTCAVGDEQPDLTTAYTVAGDFVGADAWVAAPNVTCEADMNAAGEYPVKVTADAGENYTVTCVDGVLSVRNKVTVTFDSAGGSSVATQNVLDGKTISEPNPPTKENYRFGGWYKEAACTTLWNFETDVVTGDTTLYAKWEIPVTGVKLPLIAKKYEGETYQYTATIEPSDATVKDVTWASSNEAVATVDENGLVTALKAGNTVITCTTKDGGHNAISTFTVLAPIPVTSVQLNKDKITLSKGRSETLVASILPAAATNKAVTWASSDTKIATVDSNGKVTAVSEGEATITVTTADGGKTDTCVVTVTPAEYKVTFITDGGTFVPSATVKEGGKLTAPKVPTKAGYIFMGWYKEKELKTLWDFSKDVVTEDMNLYARWDVMYRFRLTYNANTTRKVTNMPDPYESIVETNLTEWTYTITGTKPKRSGYWFSGWNTRADGKGTTYKPGSKFTATEKNPNLTLYAQWKRMDETNYKTSDDSHIRFWTALLIFSGVSLAAIGGYVLIKRKKK